MEDLEKEKGLVKMDAGETRETGLVKRTLEAQKGGLRPWLNRHWKVKKKKCLKDLERHKAMVKIDAGRSRKTK